ncbi:hypothetical protein ES703_93825 [subsurface metagenome]
MFGGCEETPGEFSVGFAKGVYPAVACAAEYKPVVNSRRRVHDTVGGVCPYLLAVFGIEGIKCLLIFGCDEYFAA